MQLKTRTFSGTTRCNPSRREHRNRSIARRAAAEGIVLLMNTDCFLPLSKDKPIAIYGAGASKTIKGGTGSGDVNERDCVSILKGMEKAGYRVTNKAYLKSDDKLYHQARMEWRDAVLTKSAGDCSIKFFQAYADTPFHYPAGDPIAIDVGISSGTDTAFFIISRVAGEGIDRIAGAGDYYLSEDEKARLHEIEAAYRNIVLVVNSGGMIDLGFLDDCPHIKAVVYLVQAGMEGGNAFADIISGNIAPSGRLTDTWAKNYTDYPGAPKFNQGNGHEEAERYSEGIFVGYRYFDTFGVEPLYSFGFGLSYTDFSISPGEISLEEDSKEPRIQVSFSVQNRGSRFAGKEVVQIYASCPQGKQCKEFKRLAAFAKTKLLAPGEIQMLSVSFPLYQLASFSEQESAWVLEAGTYGLWIGTSAASCALSWLLNLDIDAVMIRTQHICPLKEKLTELVPFAGLLCEMTENWMSRTKDLPVLDIKAAQISTKTIGYNKTFDEPSREAKQLVDTLTVQQLIELATGEITRGQGSTAEVSGISVPGSAGETSSTALDQGIAAIVLADGPAGLRLNRNYDVENGTIQKQDFRTSLEGGFFAEPSEQRGTRYYQYCTAFPVGTLLAQTWNLELLQEVGAAVAEEMCEFGVTLWLAPGMNIHRNPLCGRNFEYFSEDPLLSGVIASAVTLGVQSVPGCGTTIKHFACNNQEDNRKASNSVVSERALREIYLKGFEIAVKNAQPMAIMTSYNLLNGVHTANSKDLCTMVARDEWGFNGIIMTDWGTTNPEPNASTAAGCVRAGNDLVMPGTISDQKNIQAELDENLLDLRELKICVSRTVSIILQSNQYMGAKPYRQQTS